MYVPKAHEVNDLSVLHALIRSHPFGAWATLANGEIVINHMPFLLDASRGEYGTLVGHVARANSIWQTASASVPSVISFQGSDSYISPSWYASKHAHGKAVPTWNYAVVHAHSFPRVIQDRDWLRDHITRLTDTHEAAQALPWKVSDAPEDFIEQMARQIIGIELPIATIIGKWKVSQNRSMADRLGVAAGLLGKGDSRSIAMAELVQQAIKKDETP